MARKKRKNQNNIEKKEEQVSKMKILDVQQETGCTTFFFLFLAPARMMKMMMLTMMYVYPYNLDWGRWYYDDVWILISA